MIGGVGRAGTTLLVKYLARLGLDTTISRDATVQTDPDANAGLEATLLQGEPHTHPYVVKDPWLFQYVDELLEDPRIKIDGLILPVRPLSDAAASRVILERRSMHQAAPWIKDLRDSWDSWATTPGGVVYSLNPIDAERILAVGFYKVVEKFIAADIPVVFLHFDRMVGDPSYLYEALKRILPPSVTREDAIAAHHAIVDKRSVRVGMEVSTRDDKSLDRVALRREINRLNRELATARSTKPKPFWKKILSRKRRG